MIQMMSKKIIKIVKVGNYCFCPVYNDRLLVSKKEEFYFCIHCSFSHKGAK